MVTRRNFTWVLGLVVALLTAGDVSAQNPGMMSPPEGRVMVRSQHDFNGTVSRLKQAISGQNMMVVAEADMQQMLAMVGTQTQGMLTIEFFHPRYGKVVYENNRMAGIEAPLRLVVMEGDMGTMVSYNRPSFVFGKYRGLEALGEELDTVVEEIVASVGN